MTPPAIRTGHLGAMALVLVAAQLSAVAASPTPATRANEFFAHLQAGRVKQAFTEIFQDSPVTEYRSLFAESRQAEYENYVGSYGDLLGVEQVHKTHYGHSLVSVVYLLNLKTYPVMCKLMFYSAGESWVLVRLDFNDEFEGLP